MEQNLDKTIIEVCELIDKSSKRKFKKSQKIGFAYAYWNITNSDIIDLYNFLARNKNRKNAKYANTIGTFIDDQHISHYRQFGHGIYEQDPKVIADMINSIKENGNWLSQYDIEREFTPKSAYSSPIIYSYLVNGNKFTIDKDRANTVLGMLTEANIPTAKCIVTGGFPYFAQDNMETYIKTFEKRK